MDRIKLDKLTVDTEIAYGTFKKDTRYGVTIWGMLSQEDAEQLKQQILDDIEKAEKLDQITLRGTRPVTADWIREQSKLLLELEQENQQLKEIAKESLPFLDRIGGAIHLSDKFRKILEEK